MARKREEWITSKEAAEILTANSGHAVSDAYVRRLGLGNPPKLRSKPIDGRTKLYLKSDVEAYKVVERAKREEAVA